MVKRSDKKKFISLGKAHANAKIIRMSYNIKKLPRNLFIGGAMVVIGGLTLPLPTGSVFVVGFGVGVMGSSIPISIMLNNSYYDIKLYVETKFIKWGIK